MRQRLRLFATTLVLLALVADGLMILPQFRPASAQQGEAQLSAAAQRQIKALLDEKKSRTAAQKKMDSQLLFALKARRGEPMTAGGEVRSLRSAVEIDKVDEKDQVLVDIKADVNKELIVTIKRLGGEIAYVSDKPRAVRARVPLDSLEELASLQAIRSIRPAAQGITHRQLTSTGRVGLDPAASPLRIGHSLDTGIRPDLDRRVMNVRTQFPGALARVGAHPSLQDPVTNAGSVTSQGDTAHRVAEARNFFGTIGLGVKIGVISDSVDFLERSIASGELPPDVTVLPGQGGSGSGEGTALLEIIHDLAPGAKLFFATGFNGIESFADNIRALRAAGCDIIVDDVIYLDESPFHDDIVSTAVEEVVADGALYFSSAGNEGNLSDGTSGTWEGDFKDSGATLPSLSGGTLHDFGNGAISNFVTGSSLYALSLHWSDPLGASDNDYDLFIMDRALTTVLAASTTVQDGDDDPIELTGGAPEGTRVVIFKAEGAEQRAIHLNNFRGELGVATPGTIRGHAAAAGGLAVAAIDVALAGGRSFSGGPTNFVEYFSADGPRRVFYKSDGTPFTPGNLLFTDNGGEVRKKPDLTAADGVATSVPGFERFFGTSAAAPHAAAIAALLKSAEPKLEPNRIRQAITRTAIDIETAGVDRDSGAGIVDAYAALQFIEAAPAPSLEVGTVAAMPISGDGDEFIEPGESATITVPLVNVGGATALGVSATLTTSTPGITITAPSSSYPNIGSNGQSAANITPFAFSMASAVPCALVIDFTLTVTYANSTLGPQVLTFKVQTGEVIASPIVVSYTGPPVPIPDLPFPPNTDGVTVPLVVSGLSGPINNLKFRFDGSLCTDAEGATTVGLDHPYVADLVVTLISPQGTSVNLMNIPGSFGNDGNNFCNVVLDDNAAISIENIVPSDAPFPGIYKPRNPLSAFKGENGNGTWKLHIYDLAYGQVGNLRAFSLVFSTFSCDTP
jgi:Subtilase family/Proprotein convertase P-domain